MDTITGYILGRQQGERFIWYNKDFLKTLHSTINIPFLDRRIMFDKVKDLDSYKRNKGRVDRMITYYTNHNNRGLYEKTDIIFDQKTGICFYNTQADDLRKLRDGENYKENCVYESIYMERYPINKLNLLTRYLFGIE